MTQPSVGSFADTYLIFQRSSWYRALTLSERSGLLRSSGSQEEVPEARGDAELAERRLKKWQAQPPFTEPALFAQRLAQDEMTEEDLRTLLGEPVESVQARTSQTPEWLQTLSEAFASFEASQHFDLAALQVDQQVATLLKPLDPLLKHGYERLKLGIQEIMNQHRFFPSEKSFISSLLFRHIPEQVLTHLIRTLTLELHIAGLQKQLQGETSGERFQSFIKHLCEPGAILALLQEYPVLARLLVDTIDQGIHYSLEFLQHLCADWHELLVYFAPERDPGMLTDLHFGAGDLHRHGRSVIRLTFDSGFKLIYKPRSLSIDVHFHTLLAWINERGEHPALHSIRVLDRGSYGWSEYVENRACSSPEEIRRFYERLGGYMAIMYVLEATDLHHENMIACGEHPMFIDLETLFQPYLENKNESKRPPLGMTVLHKSLKRSSLLPSHTWKNPDGEGIDISGLGGKGGQLTPSPLPQFVNVGTDQMRLVRQRAMVNKQQNQPALNNSSVEGRDYLPQLLKGFRDMYLLLQEHRDELLTSILPLFARDETRFILRATRNYHRLLQESLHPTLLRNALDRNRLFDHLWEPVPKAPWLAKGIAAEIGDLEECNVPFFSTRPDTCELFTSSGKSIPNFFSESGMATVEQKLRHLNEQDLARQCWIIEASIASVEMGGERAAWKGSQLLPPSGPLKTEDLMQEARKIGDRLCELAIRGEDEVSWLNLQLVGEQVWNVVITNLDLYSGVVGIGFFLAYLGMITGETKYSTLAREVVVTARHKIVNIPADSFPPGGFSGWGALIYLYTHLAVLWNEPELLSEAESLVERFASTIEKDEIYDVIGGSAGCLKVLLSLYQIHPSMLVLNTALRCGHHLLARATPMESGTGWLNTMAQEKPLTGYSHGAAGIALSLLELAAASGDEQFRQTALAALEYERSQFLPEIQNWPDLRTVAESTSQEQSQRSMVTWCHGAPGIGLARLASLTYLDDAMIRAEIETALKTTLASGFGMNHSLCHGDLGNLDILLIAGQVLPDELYREQVTRQGSMILESIRRQGWLTGVPLGIETPGLMTGIAGIGYQLLRLADPGRVPSVLLLEAPRLEYLRKETGQ